VVYFDEGPVPCARLDKIQAVVTEEQLPAHHKGGHTEDAAFDRLPVSFGQ
jgi:hypothetical protein